MNDPLLIFFLGFLLVIAAAIIAAIVFFFLSLAKKGGKGEEALKKAPKAASSGIGKGWWWKLLLILFLLPSIVGFAVNIFLGFKQVTVTRYLVPIHEVECPMSAAIPGETYQYTLRRWETKEFRVPVGYLQCHDSPVPLEVIDTWNGQRQAVRWD